MYLAPRGGAAKVMGPELLPQSMAGFVFFSFAALLLSFHIGVSPRPLKFNPSATSSIWEAEEFEDEKF